jgi:flagellar basal body-associated protein FliL
MADLEETLVPLVRSTLSEVLKAEGLVTEAMRDLVRDEIKAYMRAKLDQDEELKQEIKDALNMYLESRAKELLATVRLAKAGAKMSFAMLPEGLKEEIKDEILGMFEKELAEFLERV